MKHFHPTGVSKDSTSFFYTPPENTPDFLYYPLCMGHYSCTSSYHIERDNYDSFLMLFTEGGSGIVEIGNKKELLTTNTVCILDCYRAHRYYTLNHWDFYWLHFDGKCARSFFDYLRHDQPLFIQTLDQPLHFKNILLDLYNDLQLPYLNHDLTRSQNITQLLTILGNNLCRLEAKNDSEPFLSSTLKYIQDHLHQEISLDTLSKRVALSPFYFSRKFKKLTGYTPYRYILISRISLAKFYLKSSNDSVKNIGLSCGFRSEHSFCTTFKKEMGITPSEYRLNKEFLE